MAKVSDWYEQINQEEFERVIMNALIEHGLTEEQAQMKLNRLLKVSIFDSRCEMSEGVFSVRYCIVTELLNMGIEM